MHWYCLLSVNILCSLPHPPTNVMVTGVFMMGKNLSSRSAVGLVNLD